jgi:integrase
VSTTSETLIEGERKPVRRKRRLQAEPVVFTVAKMKSFSAKPRERREIGEAGSGLRWITQPSGAMSWAIRLRVNGRSGKLTLGTVDLSERENIEEPKIGAPLTILEARQFAASTKRAHGRGEDVIGERRASRKRKASGAVTFDEAVKKFVAKYRTEKRGEMPRRWREGAAVLGLKYPLGCDPAKEEPVVIKGSLADVWRDKAVASLTAGDIREVVDQAGQVSPGRGRRRAVFLSIMFGWLLEKGLVTANPVSGVAKPGPGPGRERTLSEAEIRTFWAACGRLGEPYGSLFKFLLLTGARLREAAGATAGELVESVWTVPGNRTKNGRVLELTLPAMAKAIIDSLPKQGDTIAVKDEETVKASDYTFSVDGKKPVTGFSTAKGKLDDLMAEIAGHEVAPWRLHDLRRTMASGLAALGVPLVGTEKILNHSDGVLRGVAGVYTRYDYRIEKINALACWGAHLDGLVNNSRTGNVVTMPKPKRRR